jgi:hypothetical protein
VQSLAPGSTATVDFLQAPPKRWRGRAVPMEQMPSVSATVEIFSTPSRYACPTCPKPPPKTPGQQLREDLHVANMAVAGYATGTVIQAIFNALGLGPDRVFELIMKNPPLQETGPTRGERKLMENAGKPPDKPSPGFKVKQQFPGVYGED